MGRLTVRNFENEACCTHGGCDAYDDCYECPGFQDILAKLAHYEDLEEKCIEETTFSLATMLRKWKEFQDDIVQFVEWRELAKKGRLVVLPCNVTGKQLSQIVIACPSVLGFKNNCGSHSCESCWEAALQGGGQDE